jgi:hypothetical protein
MRSSDWINDPCYKDLRSLPEEPYVSIEISVEEREQMEKAFAPDTSRGSG